MYGYHHMMGWGAGIGMILFWVLLIVVIIVLIKFLMSKPNAKAENKEIPLEILNRRYASGEIDKAEYEEKKKDLQT